MLGTPDYWRVRLGIGHPGEKERVLGHVLGDFAKADATWLVPLLDAVADAAPLLVGGQAGGVHDQGGAAGARTSDIDGLQLRHRRPAQRRQDHAVQRADRDRRGAGGELSVLHHRAECRPRRGARPAAGRAGARSASRRRSCRPAWSSSTSPGWCAGPARARAWATSSSPTSARWTPSSTCCAASRTPTSRMSRAAIDPMRDAETVETELMLADLESLEKRLLGGCRRRRAAATRRASPRWR